MGNGSDLDKNVHLGQLDWPPLCLPDSSPHVPSPTLAPSGHGHLSSSLNTQPVGSACAHSSLWSWKGMRGSWAPPPPHSLHPTIPDASARAFPICTSPHHWALSRPQPASPFYLSRGGRHLCRKLTLAAGHGAGAGVLPNALPWLQVGSLSVRGVASTGQQCGSAGRPSGAVFTCPLH